MKYSRRCFVMKYRQNPLPIARRYRPLKSAKTDGDVEIGKYPGLVSSSARAFPDCSSDIIVCRLFLTVAGPLRLIPNSRLSLSTPISSICNFYLYINTYYMILSIREYDLYRIYSNENTARIRLRDLSEGVAWKETSML